MWRVVLTLVVALAACSSVDERTSEAESAVTTCLTLGATADTMVSNPPIERSFGSLPIMRAGGKDESLVRFDLGSIPASAALSSATLKLYVSGSGSTAPVYAHAITAPWTEDDSYASFGDRFDHNAIAAFATSSTNVQKSLDVTVLATNWVSGARPNYGVLLETNSDKKTIFVSREGGTSAQRPQLEVCYVIPDDHCGTHPCQNGATCTNTATSFTCTCAPGYTGATCDTLIDTCASQPCQNGGTCVDGVGSYTCTCPTGYAGATCETIVDACAPNPCENGGVCTSISGSYTCSCVSGFTGARCEVVDSCATQPCLNGGTCMDVGGGYTCGCPAGFTGTNCEANIDDCATQPCHNGGTCVDGVNSYTCSCAPGWGGLTCDANLNLCAQNPCLNGGSCTDGLGAYMCSCAAGYTGTQCEIDIDECASHPCQNGGTCVDGVASYTCECPIAYAGTNCETALSCQDVCTAQDTLCMNGCTATYDNCKTQCSADPVTACIQTICPDHSGIWCTNLLAAQFPSQLCFFDTTTNALQCGGLCGECQFDCLVCTGTYCAADDSCTQQCCNDKYDSFMLSCMTTLESACENDCSTNPTTTSTGDADCLTACDGAITPCELGCAGQKMACASACP